MLVLNSFHSMEARLRSQTGVIQILHLPNPGPRAKKILEMARQAGVRCTLSTKSDLLRLGGEGTRDMVMECSESQAGEPHWQDSLGQALEQKTANRALFLALDSITDPHNLGAICRTADLMELDGILLPSRRSAQENATVSRTSAGADAWVPFLHPGNLRRCLTQAKEMGYWILGADMSGTPIHQIDATRPLILVMGSEGKGLGRLLSTGCDQLVSIPQGGHIDSLNVSVATAILVYEIRRQQGFAWT